MSFLLAFVSMCSKIIRTYDICIIKLKIIQDGESDKILYCNALTHGIVCKKNISLL